MNSKPRNNKMIQKTTSTSLQEINSTVTIPKGSGFFRNLLAFSGPGALVAVGYMDPGNWITSIVGGAKFKYTLMSVVLISSLIAMLLQYMAAKLGIVTQMDLAQATRQFTSKRIGFILWIVTELAIMATDIAEVIGSAIALELLFKIPLVIGVALTALDVLLLLLLTKMGFRKIEAIVITLILVILLVFSYEVFLSKPDSIEMIKNFIPNPSLITNGAQLSLGLGIIGATVMPHNLYLHSSIAQSREYNRDNKKDIRKAVRFNTWDSNIQLTGAFIVNCLLLVLGAALFFGHGSQLNYFSQLYNALKDHAIVGSIASSFLSVLFAIALLASGQNSTITGTLTGQVIMEGFIHLKMPLWIRRLVTRGLSIVPIVVIAIMYGGKESVMDNLLVYSQIFLSIALPFSMIPLVIFTSSKKIMGEEFANNKWITWSGWISAIFLTILNLQLIYSTIFG